MNTPSHLEMLDLLRELKERLQWIADQPSMLPTPVIAMAHAGVLHIDAILSPGSVVMRPTRPSPAVVWTTSAVVQWCEHCDIKIDPGTRYVEHERGDVEWFAVCLACDATRSAGSGS